ncbi:MAG: rhodanese-like domain-containing protein [Sedimentitalea sp.]
MADHPSSAPLITRRRLLGLGVVAIASGYVGWRQLTAAPLYAGGSLEVRAAHKSVTSGDVMLIDIRRPDEWKRTGTPQGAHLLDMRREDFASVLTEIAAGDTDRPIALICARGVRSARTSLRLSAAGFTNIIDVPEGMLGSRAGPGWLKQNLPTDVYPKG